MSHLPGLVSHRNGDIGKLFGVRAFMHRDIADKHRPTPRNNDRGGHELAVFGRANDPSDMFQTWLKRAGNACHQCIGMPATDHAGGKYIAVKIDHALAVTMQLAIALQFAIEKVGIFGIMFGYFRIGNRQIFRAVQTQLQDCLFNPVFPAKQDRMPISGIAKCQRRADHPLFFAFGEYHAFFIRADPIQNHLQSRCCRVKPRRQIAAIRVKILDWAACHTRFHRGFGDGR